MLINVFFLFFKELFFFVDSLFNHFTVFPLWSTKQQIQQEICFTPRHRRDLFPTFDKSHVAFPPPRVLIFPFPSRRACFDILDKTLLPPTPPAIIITLIIRAKLTALPDPAKQRKVKRHVFMLRGGFTLRHDTGPRLSRVCARWIHRVTFWLDHENVIIVNVSAMSLVNGWHRSEPLTNSFLKREPPQSDSLKIPSPQVAGTSREEKRRPSSRLLLAPHVKVVCCVMSAWHRTTRTNLYLHPCGWVWGTTLRTTTLVIHPSTIHSSQLEDQIVSL